MDTYQSEIRGSYFNDSHKHNSGGQGYGIRYEFNSSDNLIEDNIFSHLRHSITVQLGASGNVHAYNYSHSPYTSQSPKWLTSDLLGHGTFSSMNLFEGNIAQSPEIDNVHGTNGPLTYFRNRVERDIDNFIDFINNGRDAFVYIHDNNFNHNIIANEFGFSGATGNSGTAPDSVVDKTNTAIIQCNYGYTDGRYYNNNDCSNIPSSLYLDSKPLFMSNYAWPPFGGDIAPNSNTIPAKTRFENGTYVVDDSTTSSSISHTNKHKYSYTSTYQRRHRR